ncbi:TonB-dependent receptor domain-containing protein [Chitinophaga sp. GCM10012297]|uniref:TonB-dependent receptor n=1 Tax=Chitinophaga chungangae TaxID=2821488 RepID=A0ABS3YJC3_9BACT|nr:outer membrane beta-barrel family protein [Chitinophaga chungangae]MBO9154798.1 TonB-dependent receptor [Chitinophaga chungangae]
MMIRSIFFCLAALLCLPATAQIKGKITDGKTGQGIGFVSVSLLSLPDSGLVKGQISDSAGRFSFENVPAGRYVLLLMAMGYQKLYKNPGDLAPPGEIALMADPALLNEVTVTGERAALQRQGDKLTVNISGNRLFNASANALDIFKKLPGLEVGADGAILMAGRVAPAVFIDGKPSPMSPEELQNYLASLTPAVISSIEVISNPSARYDGEHKGIIDIRLKRDQALGWQGTATAGLQQNRYALSENQFSLAYKTKKVAYTARAGYTGGNTIRRYGALQHLANTNIMTTRTGWKMGNNNVNLQLGADYKIHENHRVEALFRTYHLNRDVLLLNTLYTTDAAAEKLVFNTSSVNLSAPKQHNYAGNLNYSGRFGKTQLELVSSVVKIVNRQSEDIQNKDLVTGRLEEYWKTVLKNDILIRTAQLDFMRNTGKGKLTAGVKFAFTTTQNDIRYDTLAVAGDFVPDSARSNHFRYDEYIAAAYAGYEGSFKKLQYNLSLRAENTRSIANAYTEKSVTERNYLTWLPSLSLTYVFQPSRQLNLSFSRRITRPNFAQLNPFRVYFSPLNYFIGNPFLKASTTTMLSLSFAINTFNITVQAGRENDPLTRYPEYDSTTNILQYLGRNLSYNDFAAAEINFPVQVAKWWRMNYNVRGSYKKEPTPYHGVTYTIPITDYSLWGSQVFSLPRAFTFDISYVYKSRSGNGLYRIRPYGKVDLGLQRSWLNGKLNTKINVFDIFDTYRSYYIFREKQILNNELNHWFGNRKLAVNITYSFGRSTHKTRQSDRSEEENRAML